MRYITDSRCLPGDEGSLKTWRLRPKETNVEFRPAALKYNKDYRTQQALQVITLRNFKVCEQPFVDCSMKYSFK